MAVNRIGFMQGYDAYNIPAAGDKVVSDPKNLQGQISSDLKDEQPKQDNKLDLTVEVPKRENNASIENVAISFGTYDNTSIDLFSGNGLASDNMKSAISGMQKDQILHEYQYFVGSKDLTGKDSNVIAGTEDGVVIKL